MFLRVSWAFVKPSVSCSHFSSSFSIQKYPTSRGGVVSNKDADKGSFVKLLSEAILDVAQRDGARLAEVGYIWLQVS